MGNITIKDLAASIAAPDNKKPGANSTGVKEDQIPVVKLPVNWGGDPDADTQDTVAQG